MKHLVLFILLFTGFNAGAQSSDSLNTAKNCTYMSADEREMIYEINRVRSNPKSYLQYIKPLLATAKTKLKNFGKGSKNYSITITSMIKNGKEIKTIDTTWHYTNVEEVKALSMLVNELTKLKSLSVLKPDSGIYNAAKKHAADQDAHNWKLMHTGSDGSDPWDRVTQFSPKMAFGNENIAGNSGMVTARDIVIQLLVDAGIPGYGHRYNLLDPQWTHVACKGEFYNNSMNWWIQDFGVIKK